MLNTKVVAACGALWWVVVTPLPVRAQDSITVRLSGYLQPRFEAKGDTARFLLRRARFAIDAAVTPWAAFRVQVEMRTGGAPEVPSNSPLTIAATDMYMRLSNAGWALTAGQFRVPFSLESMTSSGILETTERAQIVVAARRDVGFMGEWRAPERLTIQAAVVNGDGPNRATNPDNRMAYLGRAMVTVASGLEIGAAVAAYADSSEFNVQGVLQRGRWGARGEFVRAHLDSTDTHEVGWYALATYMVRPSRVQLVGRMEQIDESDAIATDRLTGYSLGVQYFFHGDNAKLVTDYELFREQGTQVSNDRFVVQLQVRF